MRAAVRLSVLCCVCAAVACAPNGPVAPTASATSPLATSSRSEALPTCGAVEHPEEQSGGHLIGTAPPPVAYSSTPGTSGWHAGGAPRTGAFGAGDPLTEPQIVLALEVGQVVAAYDPDALDRADARRLRQLATGRLDGDLTVTPFAGDMGAALTLNAWATRQACDGLDVGVLADFVDEHAGRGPGRD